MNVLGSQMHSVQRSTGVWGTVGSWLCGPHTLPQLQASRQTERQGFYQIIGIQGNSETDEMVSQ